MVSIGEHHRVRRHWGSTCWQANTEDAQTQEAAVEPDRIENGKWWDGGKVGRCDGVEWSRRSAHSPLSWVWISRGNLHDLPQISRMIYDFACPDFCDR